MISEDEEERFLQVRLRRIDNKMEKLKKDMKELFNK